MKRSRNEIEGMALKAARGAGVPLGHAEDFARAAGVMAMQDETTLLSLVNALDGPFDVTTTDDPLQFHGPLVMVAPLAIDALRSGTQRVVLNDDGPALTAYLHLVAQDTDMSVKNEGGVLTLGGGEVPRIPIRSVTVPDAVWTVWEALAARTYVPETDASRLSGAGAGLTDND